MQQEGRQLHDSDGDKSKKDKNIAMTISLAPGTFEDLDAIAQKKRRTRAGMARLIIEDFLADQDKAVSEE